MDPLTHLLLQAMVLRSLLKITKLLFAAHPDPRVLLMEHDVYGTVARLAGDGAKVLVAQVAERLLADFDALLPTSGVEAKEEHEAEGGVGGGAGEASETSSNTIPQADTKTSMEAGDTEREAGVTDGGSAREDSTSEVDVGEVSMTIDTH